MAYRAFRSNISLLTCFGLQGHLSLQSRYLLPVPVKGYFWLIFISLVCTAFQEPTNSFMFFYLFTNSRDLNLYILLDGLQIIYRRLIYSFGGLLNCLNIPIYLLFWVLPKLVAKTPAMLLLYISGQDVGTCYDNWYPADGIGYGFAPHLSYLPLNSTSYYL